MDILEYLSAQHIVFLEELDYLEKLKASQPTTKAPGLREVTFAIAQAVKRHAQVEERLLFPQLQPYVGKELGTLEVMEFEHGAIRKILKALKQASDAHTIRVESAKFTAFLRDHIAKEEIVLFPLAEEKLSRRDLEKSGERAFRIDQKDRLFARPCY